MHTSHHFAIYLQPPYKFIHSFSSIRTLQLINFSKNKLISRQYPTRISWSSQCIDQIILVNACILVFISYTYMLWNAQYNQYNTFTRTALHGLKSETNTLLADAIYNSTIALPHLFHAEKYITCCNALCVPTPDYHNLYTLDRILATYT